MQWFFPGAEHFAQGFDIVRGMETSHPVLTLRYCNNHPDPGNRIDYLMRGNKYRVPYGMHVVPKPECSLDATTKIHSYSSSLAQSMARQSDISVAVSADVSYKMVKTSMSAAFSMSNSVQKSKEVVKSTSNSLAVSTIRCLTTRFEWADNLNQEFGYIFLHPDFEAELNSMNSPADAKRLVAKYGTHFYKWANMGGKLEQITSISDELFEEHSQEAVAQKISSSVSASVRYDGKLFGGGASTSASYGTDGSRETVASEKVEEHSQATQLRAYGGGPFDASQSTFEQWATSIDSVPVPVDYELVEIYSILPQTKNVNGSDIRELWRKGVTDYLQDNSMSAPAEYTFFLETNEQGTEEAPESLEVIKLSGADDFMNITCNTMEGFAVGSQLFLYCQTSTSEGENKYKYFFQKVEEDGSLGEITEEDYTEIYFSVAFHFNIAGADYFYRYSADKKSYEIRRMLPEGKLGQVTQALTENDHNYITQTHFTTTSTQVNHFVFGQRFNKKDYIQVLKLNSGGTVAGAVPQVTTSWGSYYEISFSVKIDNVAYLYAVDFDHNLDETSDDKKWRIILTPFSTDGKVAEIGSVGCGKDILSKNYHQLQFPVEYNGEHYIYGKRDQNNHQFLVKVDPSLCNVRHAMDQDDSYNVLGQNAFSTFSGGRGVAFPQVGANTFFLLQSGTLFEMYAMGSTQGNKYGPYAYQLHPAPGEAPMMPKPALFTQRGSVYPRYFTEGNRVVEMDVNVNGLVRGDIETISISSIDTYLAGTSYAGKFTDSSNTIKTAVQDLPIRWLSVMDSTAGKQMMYARQGLSGRYTPTHFDGNWNGILYRTDRWFYEILFFVSSNASNINAACTSQPALSGLFEITLVGEKHTATWMHEANMVKGRAMFSWKFNSTLDIGTITSVSVRSIHGHIKGGTCTAFKAIRVVDLHDVLYTTSFRTPRFWHLHEPVIPRLVDEVDWISQKWALGTFKLDGSVLDFSVSPWADELPIDIIYGYVLPKPSITWADAVSTCSLVGSVLTGEGSALQLAENGLDFCEPVWIGNNMRADEKFYEQYNDLFAQGCYYIFKTNSSCTNHTNAGPVVMPTECTEAPKPLCLGYRVTQDKFDKLFAMNATYAAGPIALKVMFEANNLAKSENATSPNIGWNTPTPFPTLSPTVAPEVPKIKYTLSSDSNQYYIRLAITHSTVPITAVDYFLLQWTGNGTWIPFQNANLDWEGKWRADPQGGSQFPLTIRMHAEGKTPLVDYLPFFSMNTFEGAVQFL